MPKSKDKKRIKSILDEERKIHDGYSYICKSIDNAQHENIPDLVLNIYKNAKTIFEQDLMKLNREYHELTHNTAKTSNPKRGKSDV